MTVFENVAFGLESRHMGDREVRDRVKVALDAVHMTQKTADPVPTLSGGEQQRVAVARALVLRPQVLLFDEPLSNLDAALRTSTREEIKTLQRESGVTTVYVTHDQGEGMTLADRIAVMRDGVVRQVGTPRELYEAPRIRLLPGSLAGPIFSKDSSVPRGSSNRVPSASCCPQPLSAAGESNARPQTGGDPPGG